MRPVSSLHRDGPWVMTELHNGPVALTQSARSPGNTRLYSADVFGHKLFFSPTIQQRFPVGQRVRAQRWGVSFTVECGESQRGQACPTSPGRRLRDISRRQRTPCHPGCRPLGGKRGLYQLPACCSPGPRFYDTRQQSPATGSCLGFPSLASFSRKS